MNRATIITDPADLAEAVGKYLADNGFISAKQPAAWTKAQCADFLNCSTAHVETLVREKGLPCFDIAGKRSNQKELRFLPSEIIAWARERYK